MTLAAPLTHATEPAVDYPDGYRHWTHVKSLILEPGHPLHAAFGGLHHSCHLEQASQTGYVFSTWRE